MDSGILTVYAYTSDASLPVADARVRITESLAPDAAVLAEGRTDAGGYLPPVTLPAPDLAGSQSPGQNTPFFTAAVTVTHPGFETEAIDGVQIFPGTVTVQNIRMIPVLPAKLSTNTMDTPPQDL